MLHRKISFTPSKLSCTWMAFRQLSNFREAKLRRRRWKEKPKKVKSKQGLDDYDNINISDKMRSRPHNSPKTAMIAPQKKILFRTILTSTYTNVPTFQKKVLCTITHSTPRKIENQPPIKQWPQHIYTNNRETCLQRQKPKERCLNSHFPEKGCTTRLWIDRVMKEC
ncbi:hypothetical protein EJ08DRAFT_325235 [Tothia fuscella]|uniref:Uncharacterized protein n=1 Tax=Tothia fuscella TaxID=1048955 RepID=A0A9P4NN06_9PEZI|nr:hypothetical protein EJ08DRAFT_325235 [Tothia fuscella]